MVLVPFVVPLQQQAENSVHWKMNPPIFAAARNSPTVVKINVFQLKPIPIIVVDVALSVPITTTAQPGNVPVSRNAEMSALILKLMPRIVVAVEKPAVLAGFALMANAPVLKESRPVTVPVQITNPTR